MENICVHICKGNTIMCWENEKYQTVNTHFQVKLCNIFSWKKNKHRPMFTILKHSLLTKFLQNIRAQWYSNKVNTAFQTTY